VVGASEGKDGCNSKPFLEFSLFFHQVHRYDFIFYICSQRTDARLHTPYKFWLDQRCYYVTVSCSLNLSTCFSTGHMEFKTWPIGELNGIIASCIVRCNKIIHKG
jgi:hypothetical protein